jgi:hypothetical protein
VGDVELNYQPDHLMDLEPEGAYPDARLASPEKALLDHIYIYRNRNKGRSPDISEFDLSALNRALLEQYQKHYPKTVWQTIQDEEKERDEDPVRQVFGG